jgi:hypothetical protein
MTQDDHDKLLELNMRVVGLAKELDGLRAELSALSKGYSEDKTDFIGKKSFIFYLTAATMLVGIIKYIVGEMK